MFSKFLKTDFGAVVRGAAVAAAGAGLAYLAEYASGASLGFYGPLVSAALAVLVNLVRKISESKPEEQQPAE